MQPDPDRSLVAASAAGDDDAFAALVSRYQVRIVNLARALTADDGEAEDLAQETFIRVFKAIGRFRGDSTFRTWLYRVAVNVIHSHLKNRARRWRWFGPSLDEDDSAGQQHPALAVPATIEDAAARRQVIDRALGSLPPDMRIAVTLRDVHAFEYAEIAAMLRIPIGTVESRIFRARQRLRPLLAPLLSTGKPLPGRAG
jgi:RNA polymerase sigma-70 factor (ECF subfamily)